MSERKNRGIRVRDGRRILVLAALAAFVLAQSGSSRAQSQSTASKSAPASTRTSATVVTANTVFGTQAATAKPVAEAPEAAKTGGEGIKIHGHWVLVLKNPDGKIVERREFDNSLVAAGGMMTGDQILALLLSGDATPGGIAIAFISGPTTTPGLDVSSFCDAGFFGQVAVPAGVSCFGFYSATSLFTIPSSEMEVSIAGQTGLATVMSLSPNVNIVLSGNFTVPAALGASGTVNAVQTYAAVSYPLTASFTSNCAYRPQGSGNAFQQANAAPIAAGGLIVDECPNFGALTSTNLATPLSVTGGQVITVTVTLSFS